jgi:two-component sensor histidine kinase
LGVSQPLKPHLQSSPPAAPESRPAVVVAFDGPALAPTKAQRTRLRALRSAGPVATNQEAILENIGDAIYSLAPDWTVTFFNRQAERFFACRRRDVLDRPLWDSFPAAQESALGAALREVMETRAPKALVVLSPSTGRWADTRIFPLDDGGIGVSWRDVTEEKQQELALEEALKTQDLLYRELAHRVANNFQQVSSRLMLQARETRDAAARDMFSRTAASVQCMALVNRRLYRGREGVAGQDLGEFLEALAADLAAGLLPAHITLAASAQRGVWVSSDFAANVGTMVAELVMNARKYAWPAGQPGSMALTMIRDGGTIALEVRDDGCGIPPDVDLRQSEGLGLRLLERQIASLNGVFIPSNLATGGASFRLRFPAP